MCKSVNKMSAMKYFRNSIISIAAFILLLGGAVQAQTTDTVRIGDPRFMFSQISDSSYFYMRIGNRILTYEERVSASYADSSARTLSRTAYTMGHKTNGKNIVLYGIAISTTFANYYSDGVPDGNWHAQWDNVRDTVWLKVRRGSEDEIIDGTRAVDSVRISYWSEKKTLFFDGHPTQAGNDPWILFDSIIHESMPLYCGYFEHPLHIDDTNFFVSLDLVSHFETIQDGETYPSIFVVAGLISTPVTWYWHYYTHDYNPCGTVMWCPHTELEWPAILPIIAPQGTPPPGGWAPEPTEGIDKADNFDLKIYPNPARRQFSVQCGVQVLRVEMYDVMGRKVREWGGAGEGYDISGVRKGFYMLKVVTASGMTTQSMAVTD